MRQSTDEFIHASNMLRYMRQLRQAPDPVTRKTRMSLLAEETAKAKAAGLTPQLLDWSLRTPQGCAGYRPATR